MIRRQSPLHGYLFLIEVAHRMRRGVGRRALLTHMGASRGPAELGRRCAAPM